jgi:hypothetical protein
MDPQAASLLALFIPILGMMIGGFVVFSRSHIGRALADRIAGRSAAPPGLEAEVRELRGEVEALRAELTETQERLDFTERLLSAGRKEG